MRYTGTVVFVSHDRYFIDRLATRVFEIGDGKVEIYPGNYEDYLWRKQGRAAVAEEIPKESAISSRSSPVPVNGDRVPAAEAAEPKGKRLNPIKRQQMEDRLHEIEEEIARAERDDAALSRELLDVDPRLRVDDAVLEVNAWRIDRLARSTFDLFGIVKRIVDAKAQFRSLAEPWADTASRHLRELVGDEDRVEQRRLRPLRQILVAADIGQRQRRRCRMPPRGLVVTAAVNEKVEVQLPLHGAHSVVLGSRVTAIGSRSSRWRPSSAPPRR